jgi:hypothetical protein
MTGHAFNIGLLMIDEIHHIAEGRRGATLEATICRMLQMKSFYRLNQPDLPISSMYERFYVEISYE